MAIEIATEAIGLAKPEHHEEITMDHFAETHFVKMNCDDEMTSFISRIWKSIATSKAVDRHIVEDKKRRKKLPRTRCFHRLKIKPPIGRPFFIFTQN